MKKILTGVFIVAMAGCLAACGNKSVKQVKNVSDSTYADNLYESETNQEEPADNTVSFDNSFTVNKENVIKEMNAKPDFAETYPDLESIYNKASNVVVGEVMDISYTDDEAIPRTIYSFKVSDSLKGDIETNSLISISESNGYVRMSTFVKEYGTDHFQDITEQEIENGIILESLGDAPLPETGDKYVAFLGTKKQEGRIKGAYAVIGNFMGKYVLDNESNMYSRYCPSEDAELYTIKNANARAAVKEQPMSLENIKQEILSFSVDK